jgi:hypothetical protein
MSVPDLHHEAARRYVDARPIADWANGVLERLGVPAADRQRADLEELVVAWRRVFETVLVEHLTIPELAALARFYATPEGAAVARKEAAFHSAILPALASELMSWARTVAARVRGQASAGETTS